MVSGPRSEGAARQVLDDVPAAVGLVLADANQADSVHRLWERDCRPAGDHRARLSIAGWLTATHAVAYFVRACAASASSSEASP